MHSSVEAVGFLVAVAIVKTLCIGVAAAIVDIQGRRVLLLYSSAGNDRVWGRQGGIRRHCFGGFCGALV